MPRQNGRHFPDIFQCIFLNENVWISIKISLKVVPKGPINNIPAKVQIMAWRRPSNKQLSEAMVVGLLTHICRTRPQWVNNVLQIFTTPVFVNNLTKSHHLTSLLSCTPMAWVRVTKIWFINLFAMGISDFAKIPVKSTIPYLNWTNVLTALMRRHLLNMYTIFYN